jgi:tyrosyl-tRNA synthetase
MPEIKEVEALDGADINAAKSILAYEATKICHGEEAASKAKHSASINFRGRQISHSILPSSTISRGMHIMQMISNELSDDKDTTPSTVFEMADLESGIPAFKLYQQIGLAQSGSDARRLISQGGAYVNGNRIDSDDYIITLSHVQNGEIELRAGKKKFHKIIINM